MSRIIPKTTSVTATVTIHRLTPRTNRSSRAVPVARSRSASAGASAARCSSISRRARRYFLLNDIVTVPAAR